MRNCSHIVSVFCLALVCTLNVHASRRQEQSKQPETRVETKVIPPTVQYEFSRLVGPGRLKKAQEGVPGQVKRTYEIIKKGDKPVGKKLLREERIEPKPVIFLMGRSRTGFQPSRGAFVRGRVLDMSATAYDPSPQTIGPGATGRTRTGMRATYGVVAVDPRIIPLGTLVFVEGYGFAIAADTGSAIKGNRIDLCYASRHESCGFGRKKVKVHIFKNR